MAKFLTFIRRHLPTKRRLIQLYAALLYNAHLKGFISGNIYTGAGKMLCAPGLNCYSCPAALSACPLGALQNAIASSGSRTPAYMLGILMLFGLTLGRTICGFLCPFGLIQELLHKIPTPKLKKGSMTYALSFLKYILLIVFVLFIPLWYSFQHLPIPAFCKYICPAGTLEGAVGLLANPVNADKYSMLGFLFTHKFIIMTLLIGACVFVYRAFCRFLCPLGAIYGLFSKVALIGVKVDVNSCINCGRCISCCPMDIRHVSDHECIHCGKCIPICPTSAISYKAGKYTIDTNGNSLKAQDNASISRSGIRNAWITALVLLVILVCAVNLQHSSDPTPALQVQNTKLTVGYEVGMRAPDFTVPIYGSEQTFTRSHHLGKRVIINFWATWCTPCCNELPYFNAAYEKYGANVEIIAIHSNLVTDDVESYLSKYDYHLPFALDETGDVIKAFGGSTMLPLTIVVDEQGLIVYNAVGSVTPEQIEHLVTMER